MHYCQSVITTNMLHCYVLIGHCTGSNHNIVLVLFLSLFLFDAEPLAFSGNHFGSSSGPLAYSNIDCGGWETSIEECVKKSHLDIQCSHRAVAGVMCSDG